MEAHRAQEVAAQLRAKAASTTFPEEARSLRAKADELEAKHRDAPQGTQRFTARRRDFPPPPWAQGPAGEPTAASTDDLLREMADDLERAAQSMGGAFSRARAHVQNTNGGAFTRTPWTDMTDGMASGGLRQAVTTTHVGEDGNVIITVEFR